MKLRTENNILQGEVVQLARELRRLAKEVAPLQEEVAELRKEVAADRERIQYLLDIDYLRSKYAKEKEIV